MYPLLALTIDNSTILFTFGAIVLVAAFFINSAAGKWVAILGVALLVVGFVLKSPSTPSPYPPQPYPPIPNPNPYPPVPNPNPYPPVPQPTNFAAGVLDAFKQDVGTADDAVILSAMFDQFASTLEYDGAQPSPRIQSANDLGASFARLQQYRFLQNPTPIAQKFPRFEAFVGAEMTRTGLASGPLDSGKRNNAVLLFRTVASTLRTVQ